MSLVKWNDPRAFPSISSWFGDFGINPRLSQLEETVPSVNVAETDKDFKLEVAAPGKEKSDFDIAVNDGVITISSEEEDTKESSDKSYTRKEYNYSSFSRSFTLPKNVDEAAVKASYANGVLTVSIPKKEMSAPSVKKIAVA